MLYSSQNIQLGLAFKKDRSLFFGLPGSSPEVKQFPEKIRYEQLLRDLGAYKTANEAKRAGFSGEIPYGFEIINVQNTIVCTLKIARTRKEWISGLFTLFGI